MPLSRKRPIEPIKDLEIREHIKELQENALGSVIQLSAAPTADDPLLEDNEIGEYNDVIYIRVETKIYEITPSDTITIT